MEKGKNKGEKSNGYQYRPVKTVERFTSQQQTVSAEQYGHKYCHFDLI
jgi:hypothetical protein